MRNNVIEPAKQFIVRYGDGAYAKAREAQVAARKERKGQLAAFYGKVAEKIEEVSAPASRPRKLPLLAALHNDRYSQYSGPSDAYPPKSAA